MARRARCLLWDDSLLLISPFTCALPSLRPGHAIILERFVMAALHPGDAWYYPFGRWLDPSSERKTIESCSQAPQRLPCRVALGHRSREACKWRHSLLQQKDVGWLLSSIHIPVLEGAQPALPRLRKLGVHLHWFCFCEVLREISFGSGSLSVFLNQCFSAVSPGLFPSNCLVGCNKSRAG